MNTTSLLSNVDQLDGAASTCTLSDESANFFEHSDIESDHEIDNNLTPFIRTPVKES